MKSLASVIIFISLISGKGRMSLHKKAYALSVLPRAFLSQMALALRLPGMADWGVQRKRYHLK